MPEQNHPDIQPTPGPWNVDETCAGTLYIVSGDASKGTQVDMAVMTDTHRQGGLGGAKANARLLAAAPELLAALIALLHTEWAEKPSSMGEFEFRADVLEQAREVIRKAKGEAVAY